MAATRTPATVAADPDLIPYEDARDRDFWHMYGQQRPAAYLLLGVKCTRDFAALDPGVRTFRARISPVGAEAGDAAGAGVPEG